jgi:hypothetical protein
MQRVEEVLEGRAHNNLRLKNRMEQEAGSIENVSPQRCREH